MTSRIIEQIISVVVNTNKAKYSEDELRREQINKMDRIKLLQRNLSNIRVIAGINASSIANVLGLTKQAISKYEKGLMMPNSSILIDLSNTFNVNIDYFFRPLVVSINNTHSEFWILKHCTFNFCWNISFFVVIHHHNNMIQ